MNLLLQVFARPESVLRFSIDQWNLLLRTARTERVMARLSVALEDHCLIDSCPTAAWDIMRASRYYPEYKQRQVRQELRKVLKAIAPLGADVILLKGAAYAMSGLPHARGRHLSDLDILVRKTDLSDVEARLLDNGWAHQKIDSADQRYYREWMHEIPPLSHPDRGVEVDVHHTLAPLTSRLRPDPELLWQASAGLEIPHVRVLCHPDMVLHTAVHLFSDGEINGGLKDLLDLHDSLSLFSQEAGFWSVLFERAKALGLERPLFYALTFTQTLLDTPIPQEQMCRAARFGPHPVTEKLMAFLVTRVLDPAYPLRREPRLSARLLYIRSHWLRMPPTLLARHLAQKTWRRLKQH